jgi:hypothetical protein
MAICGSVAPHPIADAAGDVECHLYGAVAAPAA